MSADVLTEMRERLGRLKGYLAQDPGNQNLLAEASDLAFRIGDFSESAALLAKGLESRPADPVLLFKLGTVKIATNDFSTARDIFEQLLQAGHRHPGVSYNLAYATLFCGTPEAALEMLDGIAQEARAELPQYNMLKARVLYHQQRYEEALAAMALYLPQHPNDLDAVGLQAQILYDHGDFAQAAELAVQLITRRPNDPSAHLVLGYLAQDRKDVPAMEKHYGYITQIAPQAGRAWSGLGFSSIVSNDLDTAISRFHTSVKYMPNHIGTWHGLGWAQMLQGDLTGARKSIDGAMEVDRSWADNHGALAVIAILEGNPAEAEAEVKRGLRLDPRSPASLFARSLLLSQKGEDEKADRLGQKILDGAGIQADVKLKDLLAELTRRSTRSAGNKSRP